MDQFLLMRLVLNLFELAACLTGFFYWNSIKHSYWKWFPFYLALIFLTEVVAELAIYIWHNSSLNLAIYQYWGIPFQFLFFCWLFSKGLQPYRIGILPVYGAIIYLVIFILELVFPLTLKDWFLTLSYTAGVVIFLVLILLFFIKFSNSEEIPQYRRSMLFWVSIGMVAFYVGTMPYWGLRNTLYEMNPDLFFSYMYLSFVLDCLMYLFFALAFICGKPK